SAAPRIRPRGIRERTGRKVASRNPGDAGGECAVSFDELLHGFPGYLEWNEQSDRHEIAILGFKPFMQSTQISLGIIRVRDSAPPFVIVKQHTMIGIPQHGEIEIDASAIDGQMLGPIDAFRSQTPAVVTERPALPSRRQEIVLELTWSWPPHASILIEVNAL